MIMNMSGLIQLWPRGDNEIKASKYVDFRGFGDQSWPREAKRKSILFASMDEKEWWRVTKSWRVESQTVGRNNLDGSPVLRDPERMGKRKLLLDGGSNVGFSPKFRRGEVREEIILDRGSESPQTDNQNSPAPAQIPRGARKFTTPARRLNGMTPEAPKSRWNRKKKYTPASNQPLIDSLFKKKIEGVERLNE